MPYNYDADPNNTPIPGMEKCDDGSSYVWKCPVCCWVFNEDTNNGQSVYRKGCCCNCDPGHPAAVEHMASVWKGYTQAEINAAQRG